MKGDNPEGREGGFGAGIVLQGGQGEGQRLGDGWKEVREPTLQVMGGKVPGREDGGTGATKALAGSTPETLEGQSSSWCDGSWGDGAGSGQGCTV